MFYDIIIVGGGIAGLYTMFQLSKKYPEKKVLLLEKGSYLGGRVKTFKNKWMDVEEGAGRFSNSHTLFIELIQELGLGDLVSKASTDVVFFPSDGTSRVQTNILEMDLDLDSDSKSVSGSNTIKENSEKIITGKIYETVLDPLFNMGLTTVVGDKTLPCSGLVAKVILAGKLENRDYLVGLTFEQYARKVLSKEEVEYIKACFGYYSELVIMNAYDSMRLMEGLGPLNDFFVLSSKKGGFESVIEKMVEKIHANVGGKDGGNYKILLNKEVVSCKHLVGEMGGTGFEVKVKGGTGGGNAGEVYRGGKCVLALTKNVLEKLLKGFRSNGTEVKVSGVLNMVNKIKSGSLCRIYSAFDVGSEGDVWFKDMHKWTTNNPVRMVIPVNEKRGVVMISYSDNKFADYWWKMWNSGGAREVNRNLKRWIEESIGRKIPMPKHTQVFYWGYGVGYWGVGADSSLISEALIQPFKEHDIDLFICGESYSANYQQWIEGALETSKKVVWNLQREP
jgi:hypothetical protein